MTRFPRFEPVAFWLFASAVTAAPLLAGAVHGGTQLTLGLAALAVCATIALSGSRVTIGLPWPIAIPISALVLLTTIQLIPLPSALLKAIAPASHELLRSSPVGGASHPLSLAPRATLRNLCGLLTSLVFLLLGAKFSNDSIYRRRLFWLVPLSGMAALVIALIHPALGSQKLYGYFNHPSTTIIGPFLNNNHSAEFYEISSFCTLALAHRQHDKGARYSLLLLAALLMGSALATLSRMSPVALLCGLLVYIAIPRMRPRSQTRQDYKGASYPGGYGRLISALIGVTLAAAAAMALGAKPLVGRILATRIGDAADKTVVWADAMRLIGHHPLGIGQGAFPHVFPVYQTIPHLKQWEFIENAVLQTTIDFGFLGFGVCASGLFVLLVRCLPRLRRDSQTAALLGGLTAVLTHNMFDFGIETLGIRIPVCLALSVVFTRSDNEAPERTGGRRLALAAAALLVVLPTLLLENSETIDRSIRLQTDLQTKRRDAYRGWALFPTDYYYPLVIAGTLPAFVAQDGKSPRLNLLARSTERCPMCPDVHESTALVFEELRRYPQALVEWRTTIRLDPSRLETAVAVVLRREHTAADLASLDVAGPQQSRLLANAIIDHHPQSQEIERLIAVARSKGLGGSDVAIMEATALAAREQIDRGIVVLRAASAQYPADSRLDTTLATLLAKQGRADDALAALFQAASKSPTDVSVARAILALANRLQRWKDVDAALEGLAYALRANALPMVEVFLARAYTHVAKAEYSKAASEFRKVTQLDATSAEAWSGYASASEKLGMLGAAEQGWERSLSIDGRDPRAREALARIRALRQRAPALPPAGNSL